MKADLLVRLAAGALFVVFGAGKFVNHASEVDSFDSYGLPAPDAFVYVIGVVEVVGGALLITGFAVALAALVLAGDMVGAIVASGIRKGELISLTLAPALLVAMVYLLITRGAFRRGSRGSGPGAPRRSRSSA